MEAAPSQSPASLKGTCHASRSLAPINRLNSDAKKWPCFLYEADAPMVFMTKLSEEVREGSQDEEPKQEVCCRF